MHALRLWRADVKFLGFGAVVMLPYFANHQGLQADDGKRGWEGQVAATVKRDGEPLTIGLFALTQVLSLPSQSALVGGSSEANGLTRSHLACRRRTIATPAAQARTRGSQ